MGVQLGKYTHIVSSHHNALHAPTSLATHLYRWNDHHLEHDPEPAPPATDGEKECGEIGGET